MPRQPRLDLPGIPQHVVQRGNDRQPCFFAEIDCVRYLNELREIVQRESCGVHAYVLMTNHVHLLMTPTAAGQIARVMQALYIELNPVRAAMVPDPGASTPSDRTGFAPRSRRNWPDARDRRRSAGHANRNDWRKVEPLF